VTRPADETDELPALLRAAGAEAVSVPLTRVLPPVEVSPLRQALDRLEAFDWAVFTSARAARAAAADWSGFRGRVAAVGPATGSVAAEVTGRVPDVVPATPGGANLAAAMLMRAPRSGARVFWPRAQNARRELAAALRAAGAVLHDPVAYRTVADAAAAAALVHMAQSREVDAMIFAAPSAVASYAAAGVGRSGCTIAVLGRTTAGAARRLGLPVDVEPPRPDVRALVDSLCRFYR
jgi:uroporphyrinogen-III synthase